MGSITVCVCVCVLAHTKRIVCFKRVNYLLKKYLAISMLETKKIKIKVWLRYIPNSNTMWDWGPLLGTGDNYWGLVSLKLKIQFHVIISLTLFGMVSRIIRDIALLEPTSPTTSLALAPADSRERTGWASCER